MKKACIGFLSLALIAAAVLPFVAGAQSVPGSVSSCGNLQSSGAEGVVACIIGFFNYFVYLVVAASVVYIVIGAFRMMGEEKRQEGKDTVIYGIIALFVMMSIWGFVGILDRTFNLSRSADYGRIKLIP
jgi:hypothetical protein